MKNVYEPKKIKLEVSFGEKNVITRCTYSDLPFNSYVEMPQNGDVVISVDGKVRQPRRSENFVINFKETPKRGLFGLKKSEECDSKEYTVYFVHTAPFEGFWGGNISYKDPCAGGILEKIFINCRYLVKISDVQTFVESGMLKDIYFTYGEEYLRERIRDLFGNNVQACMLESLDKWGTVDIQKHLPELGSELEERLNESSFGKMGLSLSGLCISYSEDETHSEMRESIKTEEFMKRRAKDIKNI